MIFRCSHIALAVGKMDGWMIWFSCSALLWRDMGIHSECTV